MFFFFLFQFCDVAQVMIIHEYIFSQKFDYIPKYESKKSYALFHIVHNSDNF